MIPTTTPNREERREIWFIHLIEARRDPKVYDLETLANLSDGFTGAEIETTVGDALYSTAVRRLPAGAQRNPTYLLRHSE